MLRILRGLGGDSASLQSWRNFRHALAEFCGRVPTHFAHKQKDWTGKDITVKGEEDEQTVRELQKPFHDHFGLTRPRPKYDNADHELVSNILASLDLVLNMISQAANSHSGILWSCPHTLCPQAERLDWQRHNSKRRRRRTNGERITETISRSFWPHSTSS